MHQHGCCEMGAAVGRPEACYGQSPWDQITRCLPQPLHADYVRVDSNGTIQMRLLPIKRRHSCSMKASPASLTAACMPWLKGYLEARGKVSYLDRLKCPRSGSTLTTLGGPRLFRRNTSLQNRFKTSLYIFSLTNFHGSAPKTSVRHYPIPNLLVLLPRSETSRTIAPGR